MARAPSVSAETLAQLRSEYIDLLYRYTQLAWATSAAEQRERVGLEPALLKLFLLIHPNSRYNYTDDFDAILRRSPGGFGPAVSAVAPHVSSSGDESLPEALRSTPPRTATRLELQEMLRTQVSEHPAAHLEEQCVLWEVETGVRVTPKTMGKRIRKIGFTRASGFWVLGSGASACTTPDAVQA